MPKERQSEYTATALIAPFGVKIQPGQPLMLTEKQAAGLSGLVEKVEPKAKDDGGRE